MLPINFEILTDGGYGRNVKPRRKPRKWQWVVVDFISVLFFATSSIISVALLGWLMTAALVSLAGIIGIINWFNPKHEIVSKKILLATIVYSLLVIGAIALKG